MLKQIAWNTFKNTGNIETMMQIINMDKEIPYDNQKNERKYLKNECNQDQGNSTCSE